MSLYSGLVIGLLIGIIIRKYKKNYHGANSNIIKQNIYKFKNKYYKFNTIPYTYVSFI